MCTTFAKKINNSWWLGKTRDPVGWMRWDDEIKLYRSGYQQWDTTAKYLIQNPNNNEDGYYGGINEFGVALVATYVPVSPVGISYIRKPYVRLILEAKTAAEAVDIIKNFSPRIGGNIFVADQNYCFGIEAAEKEYFIEEITEKQNFQAVKTNHFLHLPYQNFSHLKDSNEKKWSKTHFERATELLKSAATLEDFQNILRDRKNSDQKMAICTTSAEEECYTYSAMICDCKKSDIYYCQGNPLTNEFKKYHC